MRYLFLSILMVCGLLTFAELDNKYGILLEESIIIDIKDQFVGLDSITLKNDEIFNIVEKVKNRYKLEIITRNGFSYWVTLEDNQLITFDTVIEAWKYYYDSPHFDLLCEYFNFLGESSWLLSPEDEIPRTSPIVSFNIDKMQISYFDYENTDFENIYNIIEYDNGTFILQLTSSWSSIYGLSIYKMQIDKETDTLYFWSGDTKYKYNRIN